MRTDYGAAVAARMAVVPLGRAGGQAQFLVRPAPADSLAPLLEAIHRDPRAPLGVGRMAELAGMSPRTLNRKFRGQLGTTPLRWVQHVRVQRACELLETSDLTVEQVAAEAGFENAANLRERFRLSLGTTPTAYRHLFRRPLARRAATTSAARGAV